MISIDERSLHEELQRVLKGQKLVNVAAEFSAGLEQGAGKKQPGAGSLQKIGGEQGRSEARRVSEQGEEAKASKRGYEIRLDRGSSNRLQWEDYLIGLLLQNPELNLHVCGIINGGDFAGTDTRELYHILNSEYQRDSSPSHQSLEQVVPSVLLSTVDRVQKCVESRSPGRDGVGLVKEAVQCATRLKRMRLLQLNTELKYLLHEAAEAKDSVMARQLQQQLLDIHRQLRTIDSATHLQG